MVAGANTLASVALWVLSSEIKTGHSGMYPVLFYSNTTASYPTYGQSILRTFLLENRL